ncbi:MAG TPA: hypothetical protein VFR80_15320, partial [Pyrinomonadaceae bacterium]|nr:hypothetical protein [Pyrinomonadaceae bacterium]
MSDEPTNFKVTDRRLFNPDGTPRDISPEEEAKPDPVVETTTPLSASGDTSTTQSESAAAPARAPESGPEAELA